MAALLPSPTSAQTSSGSHTLSLKQSEVSLEFDSVDTSNTKDANRLEKIQWSESESFNYAATEPAGDATHCYDPVEYFGEAEGYPNIGKAPLMVAAGTHASWTSKTNTGRYPVAIAKTFTGVSTCTNIHEDGLTRTIYTLSPDFFHAFKVERTFRFHGGLGKLANTGLRAYIPRVNNIFHYVLLPNAAGEVVTYDANNCTSSPCAITDWNGAWFAEDDGDQQGIFVIRDPSSTTPAFIAIQSGGLSNANYTSIVLKQPGTGWSGIITETEYVCFYNVNLWNLRNPLPPGCTPQTTSAATP
jgi:hypothetical protein